MVTQNPTPGVGKYSKSRVMVVGSIELVDDSGLPSTTNNDYYKPYFSKNQDGIMVLCANFKTNSVLQIPLQALRFYEQPCF